MNTVRTNYLIAFTLHWVGLLAYAWVPAFKVVLGVWYFPGWILVCLIGLAISFAFRCPACDLPVTNRRIQFGSLTLYGYTFWPARRCSRCDEPLDD